MGFADSFNFITGGPTSNSRKNTRDARARESWEAQGGADVNAGFTARYSDPADPEYQGPGYTVTIGDDGRAHAMLTDPDANAQWKAAQQAEPVPDGNVDATTDEALLEAERLQNEVDPGPVTPIDAFQATLPPGSAPRRAVAPRAPAGGAITGSVDPTGANAALTRAGATPPPTPVADELHRDRIDTLLGGINTYANDIYALSKDNTGLSAAEAQLKQATELANIQAGIETDKSQRAALGQARSARNRGDRAFLEQQAIGEAGFIGQEAARTKALTDAQARGDLADLRAKETDADRNFKLAALSKASDLGLNTAALEVDISKANLDSVTNLLNQQFTQLGIDKQLSVQQAQQMLQFTQGMAAIQFEYDQLGVTDQQEAAKLLMDKYTIDAQTRVALEKIKADNDFDWNTLLTTVIGGAASGATAAIAKSDERAKTNIEPVTSDAAELDELMSALGGYTYEYKDPKQDGEGLRFGFMAQELEQTKLGRHMVKPDAQGFKTVEIAPLALATASGLALVSERLKALEESIN